MTTVKPPDFREKDVVMGCLITAVVEAVIFLLVICIFYRKGFLRFNRRLQYTRWDPDPAELDKMRIELEQRDDQITQLNYQLKKEKNEKNDALNRLSACMSNRLRDGNADIADLSDGNRPTKLGERFSEVYDNEWTTAYTHVDKKFNKEPEVIEFLLTILQECFHTCQTTSIDQLAMIDRCITFQDTPSHLSKDLLKKVKDERKMNALKALASVQEKTMESLRQRFAGQPLGQCMSSTAVRKYTNLCTEICWLMAVQDPPMIFQFSADSNRGIFRPYTQSGKKVLFVVWPALFVKDEGALVAKGVAQFS